MVQKGDEKRDLLFFRCVEKIGISEEGLLFRRSILKKKRTDTAVQRGKIAKAEEGFTAYFTFRFCKSGIPVGFRGCF
jgi:hypothetical protein